MHNAQQQQVQSLQGPNTSQLCVGSHTNRVPTAPPPAAASSSCSNTGESNECQRILTTVLTGGGKQCFQKLLPSDVIGRI